eukprot:scaffold4277_cov405-Prasinococcus_capsulatus_cf.AAC.2
MDKYNLWRWPKKRHENERKADRMRGRNGSAHEQQRPKHALLCRSRVSPTLAFAVAKISCIWYRYPYNPAFTQQAALVARDSSVSPRPAGRSHAITTLKRNLLQLGIRTWVGHTLRRGEQTQQWELTWGIERPFGPGGVRLATPHRGRFASASLQGLTGEIDKGGLAFLGDGPGPRL